MNHEQIEGFAALFADIPKLTEIEVRHEGATLRLRRNTIAPPPRPQSAPASTPTGSATPTASKVTSLCAEHVGVFHRGAVAVGDRVKAGQVLGQIDTMRLLSDCKAPRAGTIVGLLVDEGQPVEYGQPLIELGPEEN